jgi:uncharacterized protein (DUF433 family)
MKIDFESLVQDVYNDRLAGLSFNEIAEKYFLLDGYNAQLIYEYKLGLEPIEWRQEFIDREFYRLEKLQNAHWDEALSGDIEATKVVLTISNMKKDLIKNYPKLDKERIAELEKQLVDRQKSMIKLGEDLKEKNRLTNEVLKDFEFPDH